jgi:hypothetical protein
MWDGRVGLAIILSACGIASWPIALADVSSAGAGGFITKNSVLLTASPAEAYARFLEVGRWWNPLHTYSGDAKNLRLPSRAGDCFCESLPGNGSVAHMFVVYVIPNKSVRLQGGLGPLQQIGASGVLTISFEPAAQQTRVTFAYAVSGYMPGKGLGELAAPVDGVLLDQLQRLKRYIENSKPD